MAHFEACSVWPVAREFGFEGNTCLHLIKMILGEFFFISTMEMRQLGGRSLHSLFLLAMLLLSFSFFLGSFAICYFFASLIASLIVLPAACLLTVVSPLQVISVYTKLNY